MRYVFIALVVALYIFWPHQILFDAVEDSSDYTGIEVYLYHGDNVCRWVREGVAEVVISVSYFEPTPETDFYGQWRPAENLILLNNEGGLDINTVSHEVYHVVEDMMVLYGIADPHWGAYMQGGLTSCVWLLVERDIAEANTTKFRFAE